MPLKVSAIVNVFNGENYLERALQSIYAQDYPIHEIIVIDDGSTDATPQILEKHKARLRIKRIQNSGIAIGRNISLEMATGDLIAFLDHDDIWFRPKTRRQAEAFERFPDVGVVCGNFAVRYMLKTRRLVRQFSTLRFRHELNFNEPLHGDSLGHLLREHFVGTPSAAMFRKSLVQKAGGFNPEFVNSQDYDFWLRCAVVSPFLLQSEILSYKHNHPAAASANPVKQYTYQNQILQRMAQNNVPMLQKRNLLSTAQQSYARSCYFLGNLYFEKGDRAEAFRLYGRGFKAFPNWLNAAEFLASVFKKIVRMATFGLLSRKRLMSGGKSS